MISQSRNPTRRVPWSYEAFSFRSLIQVAVIGDSLRQQWPWNCEGHRNEMELEWLWNWNRNGMVTEMERREHEMGIELEQSWNGNGWNVTRS